MRGIFLFCFSIFFLFSFFHSTCTCNVVRKKSVGRVMMIRTLPVPVLQ